MTAWHRQGAILVLGLILFLALGVYWNNDFLVGASFSALLIVLGTLLVSGD